ncbi:RICIN domain-containing protein [Paractinoplanes durhamensis]|uniref:Ricin B lectin domain-containing protein n=1 Tax=Paractinoplanes durhamensis TaxID=113563 RepID=A0ABQ3ZDZ3_9ACTN|nr:RICIN domain-containing protein [Actinoplanes durhamensis]GIE07986.1 hypothetical protein Adu01nite_93360 [Actinoplanes durhamensis]
MIKIAPAGDRGSLPMALLLTLVGMTLSATLANLVLTTVQTSSFSVRRGLELHAAQAGLEVARGQVRGAVKPGTVIDADGDYAGFSGMLPCGPLVGFVDAAKTLRYSVTIAYYQTDPQDMTAADLVSKKVTCTGGPYGPAKVPAFALFTSTGTVVGKTASRTLSGTYIVHTSNANISGGLIHIYRASGSSVTDLCIDAGSGDPAVGYKVTMQPCSAGKVSQSWAYSDTLQIQLVSSQTPDHAQGTCLDSLATHAAGNPVYMGLCETSYNAIYRQSWSFNDSANLMGSKVDGSDIDSYCFNVTAAATVGAGITLQTNCNKSYDNVQTFSADANVGAGAASSATGKAIGQLINYNQFGRCLDDTSKNINATNMIAWPCKQNPNPNKVSWNQRYTPKDALPTGTSGTAANKITTVIRTSTTLASPWYCIQSPLATSVGSYVTTKSCVDGQANQKWTIYGRTEQYATSYTIVDNAGYCLQPRDPADGDLFQTVNSISKIYVAACDGSTLQKWNANKNVVDALALKDLSEK